MKETMTSINKPHTDNIFSGIKKVEWRTYSLPPGRHHVYETKKGGGLGMVIGTFRTNTYYRFTNVSDIPEWLIRDGCVSRDFLKAYARGRSIFANIIYDVERFELPKSISEYKPYCKNSIEGECTLIGCHYQNYTVTPWDYSAFMCMKKIKSPPQSFMYVDIGG